VSWAKYIGQFSVADVMALTGAPMRTVYSWREGAKPPAWVQALLVPLIEQAEKRRR
jgi:hypothetical protein